MRFTLATAVAVFGATAFAQPATENVDIADLSVWKSDSDGTIQSISFKLSGADASGLACAPENPSKDVPTEVYTCGGSKYRFSLLKGESTPFALQIYHETGTAVGLSGRGDVFTYCHAGGAGRTLCHQQEAATIVIKGA